MTASKGKKAVGFVPAVTFQGYPDGVKPVWYRKGERSRAPAEYVDLLRAKGLVEAGKAVVTEDEKGEEHED